METDLTRRRDGDKTPTAGHPIRLQRVVSQLRPLPPAAARRAFRQRAEFSEHADQQFLAALHVQLAIDAPQVGVHGVRRQAESLGGALLRLAVEDGAHDAAFPRRETQTGGERAPFAWNEDGLAGSHGVPICPALRSHRQTGPSSGSTTSPICTNPHFVSTRVDALACGSVWARITRTRASALANRTSAAAASVAYPRPSRDGTTPYAISTVPSASGAPLNPALPMTRPPLTRSVRSVMKKPWRHGSASSPRSAARRSAATQPGDTAPET